MNWYTFIFDTNFIYDSSWKVFFWNQKELKKFSEYWNIIFPKTVILEREYQINNDYKKQIEILKKNCPMLYNFGVVNTENVDLKKIQKQLKESIKIRYKTIDISDTSVLFSMRDLAINRKAPFEYNEKFWDKWFKDCFIYFSILEYQKEHPKDEIYFITWDNRFKEAFLDTNIKVIWNFSEFISLIDKNLLKLLRKHFKDNNLEIHEVRLNNQWDLIVSIFSDNQIEIRLAIKWYETGEYEIDDEINIDCIYQEYSLQNLIDYLCNSESFSETHVWISIINKFFRFLSKSEAITILEAFDSNTQINRILNDEDVYKFAYELIYLANPPKDEWFVRRIWQALPFPF